MRICLLSRENPYEGDVGGIASYTATVAGALAGLGHTVGVVTRGPRGVERRDGVRVISLEHRWLPLRTAAHLLDGYRFARAASLWRPDVVEAPEWHADGWWIARRGRLPLLTKLHTPTYMVERLNGELAPRRTSPRRRLERDQAARSTSLIAPTRVIADQVAVDWAIARERIEVVPNPADGASIRATAAKRPPLDLPRRFVLYIGRLERRKGVHVLADALPRVLGEHPDLHALLVGADSGQGSTVTARLEREAESLRARVRLLGELPREDALSVMRQAEIVVLPSLWENCANVATEALALGRPVIASAGSGLAEIVEDGRSGWLVPPGDAGALADSLLARLGDPESLRRAGEAALERAEAFEPRTLANRLVGTYERTAAEHRGTRRRPAR